MNQLKSNRTVKISIAVLCVLCAYSAVIAEDGCTREISEFMTGMDVHVLFPDAEIVENDRKIDGPVFPDAEIECHLYPRPGGTIVRNRSEVGSYDGLRYSIFYESGIGSVQGVPDDPVKGRVLGEDWGFWCELDEFDDLHTCILRRDDLRIVLTKDGSPLVIVGSDHYPDSEVAIRFDKDEALMASETIQFSGESAELIIKRLRTAKRVLTRYQEWPYQKNLDNSFEPYGFEQAWEMMTHFYETVY